MEPVPAAQAAWLNPYPRLDDMSPRMSRSPSNTALASHDEALGEMLPGQVIGRVVQRQDEMLDAILRELRVAIPNYAELDDPAMQVEERARVTALVLLCLSAVLNQPFDDTLIDAVRRTARRRAARGFPLAAMLRASDLLVRITWEFIAEDLLHLATESPAEAYRLTTELSTRLLGASARLRREEIDAYLHAEREHGSTSDKARRMFLDELLTATANDPEDMHRRAAQFGYRLGDEHAVAVLTVEGPSVDGSPADAEVNKVLRRLNEAVAFAIVGTDMPLVQTRRDSVVAVFPASQEDGEETIRQTIESAVGPVDAPAGWHLIAGLGRIEPALTGVAVSYRQAQRALEAAHVTGMHTGVVSYADMLPSLLLLEDPALAKDSWRTTVEPLSTYDAANGTQLVATLSVYLEERGVLAATAQRLFVHRHTLAPRLEQIEQLTGRSLQDRNDLFMLELGLRAHMLARDTSAANGS